MWSVVSGQLLLAVGEFSIPFFAFFRVLSRFESPEGGRIFWVRAEQSTRCPNFPRSGNLPKTHHPPTKNSASSAHSCKKS